ncbi:glycosyltransferase family 2 protein [Holophaga foetida]|uniref:glycosyltransferase family 2 protein n=1 Tax=Holophaga foetida TaxID=35839 RepID=UPI00024721BF|nr:glycosyltransferase [Holophaga foetida]
MKTRLCAVILSRGLDEMLRFCLKNFFESAEQLSGEIEAEAIVVDNASPRPYLGTSFSDRRVRLLRFDAPTGFAAACNRAVQKCEAEQLLFLNNDVFLDRSTLGQMLQHGCDADVGVTGSWLYFPDGRVQHRGVVFGNDDIGPYHLHRGQYLEPRRPLEAFQAVTGACMVVGRELFNRIGGFDESYAFGLEDIDFCLRVRQCGQRVICVDAGRPMHFESFTPGRVEMDVSSRRLFMERWRGKYTIDG